MSAEEYTRELIETAQRVLDSRGYTAAQYLKMSGPIPFREIVRFLGNDVVPLGLVGACYFEAEEDGATREVAKDMLIRHIRYKYPNGWKSRVSLRESTSPLMLAALKKTSKYLRDGALERETHKPDSVLFRWVSEFREFTISSAQHEMAERIFRSLVTEDPPSEGWTPSWPNDPRIDELFNRHWPLEKSIGDESEEPLK